MAAEARLQPTDAQVGDGMNVAAVGLDPNQVATLRVTFPDASAPEITTQADYQGTIGLGTWDVFTLSGHYVLDVLAEDGTTNLATTSVDVP